MNLFVYAVFILLLYMHIETRRLKKNRIRLLASEQKSGPNFYQDRKGEANSNSQQKRVPHFKIAHLSDLHIGRMYVRKAAFQRMILEERPDCIVLTGDYIEKGSEVQKFIDFINEISFHKIPVMLVWGNHDHKVFAKNKIFGLLKKALTEAGVMILQNEHYTIEKNGRAYCFIGVDELYHGTPQIEEAFREMAQFDFKVVLTHNPDMLFRILPYQFDIMLSGHFHGGQIYMPFHFEFRVLRDEKMCKLGKIKGYHTLEGKNFYIHRGIGNVMFPFRFLSPPEIVFFEVL